MFRLDAECSRVSKPDELVPNICHETLATARESFELPRHCHVLRCEVDSENFAESTKTLVETYTGQVLNEKSNISSTDEGLDAYKIVVQALDRRREKTCMRL